MKSFHIDGKRVQGWADDAVKSYWPIGFPAIVALSMLVRLVQMLIYGVVALIVASSVRPPLGFGACMRLAALAITPVILLDTVFWLTGANLGCSWFFIAIGLEITLLILMVRSNNDPAAPMTGVGSPYGYGPPPGAIPPGGYAPPQQAYGAPGYAPVPPQQGYPPQPPAPPAYNPPPPPRPGY